MFSLFLRTQRIYECGVMNDLHLELTPFQCMILFASDPGT